MENTSRDAAAFCAMRLSEALLEIRQEVEGNPEYHALPGDPLLMAILLVLAGAVMADANWQHRHQLYECYGDAKWPNSVTVRKRIEEILTGVNIRADYWNMN